MFFTELERGVYSMDVLIKDVQEKLAKTGKTYVCITIFDGQEDVKANMFSKSKEDIDVANGDIAAIKLEVGDYNGKPSYTIIDLRPNPLADKTPFIATAPISPVKLYNDCLAMVTDPNFKSPELTTLVTRMFSANKEKLLHWSAAKVKHHNVVGGLLWHSYNVAQFASRIASYYDFANYEVVVAGALIHDIGKIYEMDTDPLGVAEYTEDGSLFGHLFMGANMVEQYGKICHTDPALIKHLQHIVLSHHGKREYGAVQLPATPEAFIVHTADATDAKMFVFEKECKKLEKGEFSDFVYDLETRVYKA